MQYLTVATLSVVLYCFSIYTYDYHTVDQIYEWNLIVRNLSSILLAYGVSNSIKQALEAEIRERDRDTSVNDSLNEEVFRSDPAEMMRIEVEQNNMSINLRDRFLNI